MCSSDLTLNPYAPLGVASPTEPPVVDEDVIVIPSAPADNAVAVPQHPEITEESLPQASERYEVKSGDSLEKISVKFYSKRTMVNKIAEANNLQPPYRLKIGQILIIPRDSAVVAQPSVATVEQPGTPSPAAPGTTSYKVEKGDTLQTISKKFYGTFNKWRVIADANNISNPASLRIGQVLSIPQAASQPAAPAPAAVAAPASDGSTPKPVAETTQPAAEEAAKGRVYVVQQGDSLWKIAAKFYGRGDLHTVIEAANKDTLKSKNLKVGQKLVIPEIAKPATPQPPAKSVAASKSSGAPSVPAKVQDEVEVLSFYE